MRRGMRGKEKWSSRWQVREEEEVDRGMKKEKMMEGGGSLHSLGGSEGTWTVERRQPMATRTLWLDNEEVPRCQTPWL